MLQFATQSADKASLHCCCWLVFRSAVNSVCQTVFRFYECVRVTEDVSIVRTVPALTCQVNRPPCSFNRFSMRGVVSCLTGDPAKASSPRASCCLMPAMLSVLSMFDQDPAYEDLKPLIVFLTAVFLTLIPSAMTLVRRPAPFRPAHVCLVWRVCSSFVPPPEFEA